MHFNGKDTLMDYSAYHSVLGGVTFNNLEKGAYGISGKVVFRKNKFVVEEVPFNSEFTVK